MTPRWGQGSVAEAEFRVEYDGEALRTGRMPVRELAPALLALGDLFAEASTVIYPDRPPASLEIKATEAGSFDVHLILSGIDSAWDQIAGLASSEDGNAIKWLVGLIASGYGASQGLFAFQRWLKGRRSAQPSADPQQPGLITFTDDDGNSIQVPSEVVTLNSNVSIRKKTRAVVEPLDRQGVDELRFVVESETTCEITRSDVAAFTVPEPIEEELSDDVVSTAVEIVSPDFVPGNKWRVTDGNETFWVAIDDEVFWARVARGQESFSAGDILRCRMRFLATRGDAGLRTERSIVEVLEHIPKVRPVQMPLTSLADGEPA